MTKFGFKTKYGWANVRWGRYSNNNLAIQLMTDSFEPLARMSVNLPDIKLQDREFFLDINQCHSLVKDILDCGHFEYLGRKETSGFVEYSLYRVKDHVPVEG